MKSHVTIPVPICGGGNGKNKEQCIAAPSNAPFIIIVMNKEIGSRYYPEDKAHASERFHDLNENGRPEHSVGQINIDQIECTSGNKSKVG